MLFSLFGAYATAVLVSRFPGAKALPSSLSDDVGDIFSDDGGSKTFCGLYDKVNTTSHRYTILSNQWASDGSGTQCITADLGSSTDNQTSFNATWSWFKTPTEIHSFPSVVLNSKVLPVKIANITSLQVDASWAIVPSGTDANTTDADVLANVNARTDVALDMFLDTDAVTSSNTTSAGTEIMVWQADYGNIFPLGWDTLPAKPLTAELAGVNYTLYQGKNQNGQQVYTWVPTTNQSAINTNVFPLVQTLLDQKLIEDDMYIGLMQFGAETMHSNQGQNITFMVSHIGMNVNNEDWTPADGGKSGPGDSGGSSDSGDSGDSGDNSTSSDGSGVGQIGDTKKGSAIATSASPVAASIVFIAFLMWTGLDL